MQRRNRNPRRAYDENGREIPPPMVRSDLAQGIKTVEAHCQTYDCRHFAVIPLEGWPLDLSIPDMALKLRCSKCGGWDVKVMKDMSAHYETAHGVCEYPPG